MRLLFSHPGLARLACATCEKYVANMETGEILRYPCGDEDNLVLLERTTPPPCMLGTLCPKESPDREHWHVLSPRNCKLYHVWTLARAQRRFGCPDALRAEAFRVLDDLMRVQERRLLAGEIYQRLKRC